MILLTAEITFSNLVWTMPIIKSAQKRMRQTAARKKRLLPYRSHMKTMIKKITDLAAAGKASEAAAHLQAAYKAIDLAAKKNIIHKRTAARRKSRVARLVSAKA